MYKISVPNFPNCMPRHLCNPAKWQRQCRLFQFSREAQKHPSDKIPFPAEVAQNFLRSHQISFSGITSFVLTVPWEWSPSRYLLWWLTPSPLVGFAQMSAITSKHYKTQGASGNKSSVVHYYYSKCWQAIQGPTGKHIPLVGKNN